MFSLVPKNLTSALIGCWPGTMPLLSILFEKTTPWPYYLLRGSVLAYRSFSRSMYCLPFVSIIRLLCVYVTVPVNSTPSIFVAYFWSKTSLPFLSSCFFRYVSTWRNAVVLMLGDCLLPPGPPSWLLSVVYERLRGATYTGDL